MAFAGLELGVAHRRVGRDREDQVVDLRLPALVVLVGLVADDRVLLVGDEVERPGADRLLVDLLGRARLEQESAYSADRIAAKSIARLARMATFGFFSVIMTTV